MSIHSYCNKQISIWYVVDTCSHVFMTIGNNVYAENLDKLKKLNTILNTILIVQIVLLGLNSLVLRKCWNMLNKTTQKCTPYIPRYQLSALAQEFSWLYSIYVLKYTTWVEQKIKMGLSFRYTLSEAFFKSFWYFITL